MATKKNIPKICNIVSAVLAAAFVIKSIIDYTQYTTDVNSAPFYAWVAVNALYFIIPAIIVFAVGLAAMKKHQS